MSEIVTTESLKAGIAELSSKHLNDIQVETAITWCNRACAAMHLNLPDDAREYAHEAVEHAGLSGDISLVAEVYAALAEYGIPF